MAGTRDLHLTATASVQRATAARASDHLRMWSRSPQLRSGRGYQPLRRDSSASGWLLQGGTRAGLLCTAAFMMIR